MHQLLKKDLNLTCKCAKFVPRILTKEQKWVRMTVADDNIKLLCESEDPEKFMKSIITGDETWVPLLDPETKRESSSWLAPGQSRPLKGKITGSSGKTMLTIFFDSEGIILCDFLGRRETITSERYCQTLSNLKECIRKKRPHLWEGRSFLIHHDNASPHTSDFTMKKIQKWGLTILDHPPYSPDLAPCDFALFPKLKSHLRGHRFATIASVQKEVRNILATLDKSFF